jgi:predicted aminopeptidase
MSKLRELAERFAPQLRRPRFWLMATLGSLGVALLAVGALCLGTGCTTLGYYGQAVGGHLGLVTKTRDVKDWIADPDTPAALRERLVLSQRIRDFAVAELKLPDNRSYRGYADLKRNAVVYNVVAAPELALTLKTWCFPVVGCVGYRGYFSREPADALALQLNAGGWETTVYGVPAYSTLGKTDWLGGDPLLNTFIHWPEGELARLLFHELAHQVAYAEDDTTFNESFAGAVERIGGQRWLERHAGPEAREAYAALDMRRNDFRALTLRYREALATMYASQIPDDEKRKRKAALLTSMRDEYARLKAERWGGFAGYDGWFERANNAALGVQAVYNELVPQFDRLFEKSGRDFERFYAEVRVLAALPKAERRAKLAAP